VRRARRRPWLIALVGAATLPLLGANCDRWEEPEPGLVLSAPEPFTSEQGGTASLRVSLVDAPTAEVTLEVSTADSTEGALVDPFLAQSVAGVTLRFGPSDWSVPQAVTVVGVDDDAADGDVSWAVAVTASSADERYAGLAGSLSFTNLDDDLPAIRISRSVLTTAERYQTTDSFSVVLASRPVGTVTLPIVSARPEEGRLRSSTSPMVADPQFTLVFTPSDWSTPREVIVVGQDDAIVDGDQTYEITVGPSTGDAAHSALPAQVVSVTNRDANAVGVACDAWLPWTWVMEGESTTVGCVLTGRPVADVTIPFTTEVPSQVLVSTGGGVPSQTATIVFTPENWAVRQVVTLYGVRDYVWEPWATAPVGVRAGPTASEDPLYRAIGWTGAFDLVVYDVDAPVAEGTATAPLDVTGRLPWHGMVDTTSSFYRVDGLTGVVRVSLANGTDMLGAPVDGDGDFSSGILCQASYMMAVRPWCFTRVPAGGSIWVKVDGVYSVAGGLFDLDVEPFLVGSDVPKAVPDGSSTGVTSVISVSGAPTSLAAVRVAVDATHAFAYDLGATLVSPAGTRVPLFANVYASTYSGGYPWTLFDATAQLRIDSAYNDVANAFRPIGLLEALNGEDGNGVWTLEVVDASANGYSGTLLDWAISLR
jgi:subtilisin-like proprotein convertase family protein